jgi:hypothetical protein
MGHAAPGAHPKDVGAHGGNPLFDLFLGSLSQRNHCDDGAHSDDDAEHRQEGSKLVSGKCFDGYL